MEKRASEKNIQARHDARRLKRIREQKIRRYTFFAVLGLIAIFIIMFFTPFFNIKTVDIKTVNVAENSKVTTEQVTKEIGNLTGKNLFSTRGRSIRKNLEDFAYVEKVTVKKKPFPPTLTIEITERTPTVQISYGENFAVINSEGRVLEKTQAKIEGIPVCEGLKVVSANEGDFISLKDEETQNIVMQCIEYMEKADIIKDITRISFEDMTSITFNYQSRLDVICGTHIDFQRKLGLFKEAVNSNKLTQNSRGTINLSTTGKAIYTP